MTSVWKPFAVEASWEPARVSSRSSSPSCCFFFLAAIFLFGLRPGNLRFVVRVFRSDLLLLRHGNSEIQEGKSEFRIRIISRRSIRDGLREMLLVLNYLICFWCGIPLIWSSLPVFAIFAEKEKVLGQMTYNSLSNRAPVLRRLLGLDSHIASSFSLFVIKFAVQARALSGFM
ncbi:hypothetical protein Ahy_A10g046816 isoform B [Arachis hypogaea]|uniref:Uncharacterized protein n=1 Tax=Arachis hypogaea TaxID=3818 RepID=A0A445B0P3_ARAHY|nr:hypothetical protein Ahy_A10g046816 isoform B [Arachis hypogaea]